jgi:hypothetical protein
MIEQRSARITLALLLAAATASCAGGMSEPPETGLSLYDTWDADRSGMLDSREFTAGPYESWYGSAYNTWDQDGDGFITDDEFGVAPHWPGMTDGERLTDWDADASGSLEQDEVDTGAFERWDRNGEGLIGEDELYAGTYESLDSDGDGFLSENEWGSSTVGWQGDADIGDFGGWDVDDSGLIDSTEFYEGFSDLTA